MSNTHLCSKHEVEYSHFCLVCRDERIQIQAMSWAKLETESRTKPEEEHQDDGYKVIVVGLLIVVVLFSFIGTLVFAVAEAIERAVEWIN